MLIEEARWINRQLSKLNTSDLYPLCNIGSASEHYRQQEQPYIDKYLFESARARNLRVIHVDRRPALGVDVVGDVTDPKFLARLETFNVRSVICCNLLEHVGDRAAVCEALVSIVRPGGYLVATVPHRFPYHEDPIDTLYRPTVEDLVESFPGTSVYKSALVRCSRLKYEMQGNYRALCWMGVRAAAPFYRPQRWWANVSKLCGLLVGYKVACVVMHKQIDAVK